MGVECAKRSHLSQTDLNRFGYCSDLLLFGKYNEGEVLACGQKLFLYGPRAK